MSNEINNETIGLVRKTILNRRGLVIDVAVLREALRAADLVPAQRLRDVMRESDRWAAKYGDAEARAERLEAALREARSEIAQLWEDTLRELKRLSDLIDKCDEAFVPQDEAGATEKPVLVHPLDPRSDQAQHDDKLVTDLVNRAYDTDDGKADERDPTEMLITDNRKLKLAGGELAEAAARVVRDYDGLHRLSLAVAGWHKALADEGGRS